MCLTIRNEDQFALWVLELQLLLQEVSFVLGGAGEVSPARQSLRAQQLRA
jgi:hypothetical protein